MNRSKQKSILSPRFNPFCEDSEATSPKALPDYRGEGPSFEIDEAYDAMLSSETAEEFYNAVSFLVFHARHLRPEQHAQIALILAKPFKRPRGKPRDRAFDKEIDDYVWRSNSKFFSAGEKSRNDKIIEVASARKINDEIVRRKVKSAEKRYKSEE
jgi:hypothetical protein